MGVPIGTDPAGSGSLQRDPVTNISNVGTPNDEYAAMVDSWDLVQTLWRGTPAMRAAGETYLPRFPKESTEHWEVRRDRTFLFPMFRKSIESLAAKPFVRSIQIRDADPVFEEWDKNIDLEGDNLHVFSQKVFQTGIRDGHTFLMAEMPAVGLETGRLSLEQAEALGTRPYLVHVFARQVIGWKYILSGGVPLMTQVRIEEMATLDDEFDPYSQDVVRQIRVLTPGHVEVFRDKTRIRSGSNRGASVSVPDPSHQMGLNNVPNSNWELTFERDTPNMPLIPLVPFYANKTKVYMSEPPLEDLAWTNVEHWQSTSDQNNILHIARVPRLLFAGFKKEHPATADASMAIKHPDVDAKVSWIETEARSIAVGQQSIDKNEERGAALGDELLVRRLGGPRTATEIGTNAFNVLSPIQNYAHRYSSALREARILMAMYAGMSDPEAAAGAVSLFTEFGLGVQEQTELDSINKARERGDLTQQTYLGELQRRGVVSESLDIAEEIKNTEQDRAASETRELAMLEAAQPIEADVEEDDAEGGAPGAAGAADDEENAPAAA